MLDLNSLSAELDSQNAALESMLNEFDVAEESIFNNSTSVDQMLAKVQESIDTKCNSAKDCKNMLAKLRGEESQFNDALESMKDAAIKCKNGEIDKMQMKQLMQPAIESLKTKYNMISLNKLNNDTNNVTDGEVQTVHDFLIGAGNMLNDKMNSFTAEESSLDALLYSFDEACEGVHVDQNGEFVNEPDEAPAEKKQNAFKKLFHNIGEWFKKVIDNIKNKFNKEKDPDKKNIFKRALDNIIGFFDKFKKAKTAEEAKAAQDEAKDAISGTANESLSRLDYMCDLVYEEYQLVCEECDSAMESNLDYLLESFDEACEGVHVDQNGEFVNEPDEAPAEKKQGAFARMKKAVIDWFKKVTSIFKKKENAEKDPKKKNIFKKLVDFLKGLFHKADKAKTAEEVKDAKDQGQDAIDKANNTTKNEVGDESLDRADRLCEIAIEEYDLVCEECEAAMEGTYEDFITFANEALAPDMSRAWRIKTGEVTQNMNKILKEAKRAIKAGDYATAKSKIAQAKKGYQGLKSAANKLPDKVTGNGTKRGIIKRNALNWISKKVSTCDNLLEKMANNEAKAAKESMTGYASEAFDVLDDVLFDMDME